MKIKVKGGTAKGDDAPLCVACRSAQVVTGDRGQEYTRCAELGARVMFKVVTCSEFVSRQRDLDHRARLGLDED